MMGKGTPGGDTSCHRACQWGLGDPSAAQSLEVGRGSSKQSSYSPSMPPSRWPHRPRPELRQRAALHIPPQPGLTQLAGSE